MQTDYSFASKPRRLHADAPLPSGLWRADALGNHAAPSVATGYSNLNQELPGGGWPVSVLTELLWSQHGGGEFRLLAPVLTQLSRTGKTIIILAPPYLVFAPALEQLGIDINQILIVQSEKPADRLWAVEQVLKSANFGALLCWLPQARPDHLRRLQLAATSSEGLTFVFRPAQARFESSPAPLRLLCQAAPAGQVSVEVIKRRGPVASAPVLLSPGLPSMIERTIDLQRTFFASSIDSAHALDSRVSASIAAGSGMAPLA